MDATPTLLHVMFGAEVGGCETTALSLVQSLPWIIHNTIFLGNDGPMSSAFRNAGSKVEVVPHEEWKSNGRLMKMLKRVSQGSSSAMLWHGLIRLPPMIRALNQMGIPTGVYGGNPAHTMPRQVDWKFVLLNKLYPPSGPLPIYLCCSQYVADSFETSRYLRRFRRITVPNGVGIPTVNQHSPKRFQADLPFVIGMVARLNSIKDHETLIRAFATVHRRYSNAVLEPAGEGELQTRLLTLASELGVADSVRFLGTVRDVYSRIANWDLFAFATTEYEGMGSAIAEAMMIGLPVVLTEVGPTRMFAGINGDAVRLVPPFHPQAMAEAIMHLVDNQEERTALASRGYRMAMETFHPEVFAKRYAEQLQLPTCST